jgi:hypothetical protein
MYERHSVVILLAFASVLCFHLIAISKKFFSFPSPSISFVLHPDFQNTQDVRPPRRQLG